MPRYEVTFRAIAYGTTEIEADTADAAEEELERGGYGELAELDYISDVECAGVKPAERTE